MRAAIGMRREPSHVAVLAGCEEGAEAFARFRAEFGGAEADGVEGEPQIRDGAAQADVHRST